MFLRCKVRNKNGKEHRSWSIVENLRLANGRVVQRHVLYLGEINDGQNLAWRKSIEAFLEDQPEVPPATLALFPDDTAAASVADEDIVRLRLTELKLCRPRQWGACWLALHLWQELGLDQFWSQRLPPSRKGTDWDQILTVLVCARLISPGSEWKLHRQWFLQSAMGDLLGGDFGLAEPHKLYACHDRLLPHKTDLFSHLQERWRDLFNASFEILLYDLTSTYFESSPSFPAGDKRRFGHSRDKRSDCVQVVIALIVTPEGFPLAYEVLPGNTSDKTTLKEMRAQEPPVQYLVGTPKGRLGQYEQALLEKTWQQARLGVDVKLLPQDKELYLLARSHDRMAKERSIRRRKLKWLWGRLKEIKAMALTRDNLMKKLGVAQHEAPAAWRLIHVQVTKTKKKQKAQFSYRLNKDKLRTLRRREGSYLLRSNLMETDPAKLWHFYLQLTQVEEAFKNLKGDLSIRPIGHQLERRIEAHIFICFLAYCLHVTLGRRLRDLAPGLTTRSVLGKFAAVQMLDVRIPTTDQREVILTRYTQPEPELELLIKELKLELPSQPPPKITAHAAPTPEGV